MATILPYKGVQPSIAEDAWIAPNAAIIGDVEIGPRSSVWFGCTVRGDFNIVRIGSGTNLQDNSVIHVDGKKYGTFIGDDVLIGHMCLVHACTIGDGAMIGMRACVMDGAVVEPGAMVAAGALVTPGKVVKSGQLWAGSPAKFMRDLSPEEIAGLIWAARRYAGHAEEYRLDLKAAAE
jgi:carbonic anhydrase/acetyltransferase-like protein (isoleucine patch superfamily)